jgi:CHAT domain-containing protein
MEPSYPVGLALVAAGTAASAGDGPLPAQLLGASRQAFEAAAAIADRLGNAVLGSLALGGLGRLHERSGRLDQASRLTQHALFRAQQASAPDISFRWDWQQARIERALGHEDAAVAGFGRAVSTLQSVRQDIPIEYRDGRSSFRGTFGPLYLQYVDLLLRRAGRNRRNAAPLIREAREMLERLKETELQDYFRDPCIADFKARQRGVEAVAPDTAVIYPAILPDRLELLVSVGQEDPRQISVSIAEPRLQAAVKKFRRLLERRATNEFLDPARWLHDLLIRPVDAVLAGSGVGTLVVVPAGVLRTIPFAALHDGERFLIERYALATVPGLRLVDPRPLTPEARRTLAAGLSLGRHGYPALPNVAFELEEIRRLQRCTTLLDSAFQRSRFERELRNANHTVVHIASHSQVGRDPSQIFVLAHDGQLTVDELEDSIKQTRFRELGVELLVLSACRTATGDDDRAALGLAGLALKAGARSVLATLWFVSDEASMQLTVEFYRQLQNRTLSKAGALRAAQLSLMKDPVRGHPAYWAPFLLMGNWL